MSFQELKQELETMIATRGTYIHSTETTKKRMINDEHAIAKGFKLIDPIIMPKCLTTLGFSCEDQHSW
jgi:hypothetical protein